MNKKIIDIIKEKAVKRGEFTLTSGKKSNYYIDIKQVITDPSSLDLITDKISKKINQVDKIAGVELGAIPLLSVVCVKKKLPMLIIRKKIKDHGTKLPYEGNLKKGETISIIEDVTTTGNSVINSIKFLKTLGIKIKSVITVVDRLEGAKEKIEKMGIEFIYLANLKDLGLI